MNLKQKLYTIINEELTKSEINSMITNKIDSKLSSREFEQQISKISASVVEELFKILWQKNNFWKNSVIKK
jgi:hypothetical protein